MAEFLVSALDSFTTVQQGENGHSEYGWSHEIREQIVQLSFQIVRTNSDGVAKLAERFYNLASSLKSIVDEDIVSPSLNARQEEAVEMLDMLRRMVLHTRDIDSGKGEYAIGRELIRHWYYLYPDEAFTMIKYYVKPIPKMLTSESGVATVSMTHPYGSWKDIKYFWKVFGGDQCPPKVLGYLVRLVNGQLKEDLKEDNSNPSLVARWVCRENASKNGTVPFKQFYRALAEDYFSHYMDTAKTAESKERARRKCYMDYRKQVLVPLNKKLRTPQINQCSGNWSEIDYKNDVTSITMRKQTRAFMNTKKDNSIRSEEPDRITGAANFEKFVSNAVKSGETIKGKRVGFDIIARDAWNLAATGFRSSSKQSTEVDVLNLQWENMLQQLGELEDMVPMIDLSGSMCGDPINAAMGIGLAVACKSRIGKRAMTFSHTPTWMNFQGCNKLSEMMTKMYAYRNDWGGSTNFTAALTLILDMCVKLKLSASDVSKIKLLILSDMQIDMYGNEQVTDTMWHNITQRYAEAGMRAIGEPYKPGHIIFWNLRHTNGFPTLSSTPNTTMFAGFSPVLLNEFAQKGLEALQSETPFNQLKQQLANERYNILDFP
jgi:hypothetical protein